KLRSCDDVIAGRLCYAHAARKPGRGRSPKTIEVEPGVAANPSRSAPAIAEMKRHGLIRMPRNNERRRSQNRIAVAQLYIVGDDLSPDSSNPVYRDPVGELPDSKRRRGPRAHKHRVVPRCLQDGLWQLLKPSVVCKTSVEHRRIRAENNLISAFGRPLRRARDLSRPAYLCRESLGGQRRARDYSVVNRLAPEPLKLLRRLRGSSGRGRRRAGLRRSLLRRRLLR